MRVSVLLCAVLSLMFVSSSRGDDVPEEEVPPVPVPTELFIPYDIGGEAAAWEYAELTPDDQVTADRGLNEDQTTVQNAYAAASAAAAEEADVSAAANQLGLDDPDETGVVP